MKAAMLTNQIYAGQNSHCRFGNYCDEWLQINKIRIKESTYAKYSSIIDNHIKPVLGGCFIETLSETDIEKFTDSLLIDEALSSKTVKDILVLLSSILKYAKRHYQGNSPNVEVYYPKNFKREMRVLTKDEQTRFIEYLLHETDECKFGTLLALLTGMRIGEICALRWSDISLTDGTVKIRATMQRLKNFDENSERKTKILISNPKSDTSSRVIPLNSFTLDLCEKYKPDCDDAYVLSGRSDQFVEPRTLQYRMEKYTRDCNLKDVHFHTLRHTFATRCVEVGFEIKSLSEILGHSSPQITLERYVHSSLELKRDNMNKVIMAEL